ncbi:MAG: hypothetical protein ACQEXJ_08050 [Myxococcota bacterium]
MQAETFPAMVGTMSVPPSPRRLGLAVPALALVLLGVPLARAEVETGLLWERAGYGEPVRVTARKAGPDLERAQEEVQAIADRLDALRTIRPHVVWRRIAWEDDTVRVLALAESALYANLAMAALRPLYPDRSTAGSGARPIEGAGGRLKWQAKILVHAPR